MTVRQISLSGNQGADVEFVLRLRGDAGSTFVADLSYETGSESISHVSQSSCEQLCKDLPTLPPPDLDTHRRFP